MTLPRAHHVVDGSSQVRAGTQLVYAQIGWPSASAVYKREAVFPVADKTWAETQTYMRDVATWEDAIDVYTTARGEKYSESTGWRSKAIALVFDMSAVSAAFDNTPTYDVVGETVKRLDVFVNSSNPNGRTWAVGYITQATDVPGDWTWFAGGTFVTGTSTGEDRVVLGTNIVLNNYLFILFSFSPLNAWAEPSDGEAYAIAIGNLGSNPKHDFCFLNF
jgi:hypothetical protein